MGEVRAARQLPEYPEYCRIKISPQIQRIDDVRVIGRKLDAALYQQWGRVDDCAEWFDQLRAGLLAASPERLQ